LRGFLFLGVGVLSRFGLSSREDGPGSAGFPQMSMLFSKKLVRLGGIKQILVGIHNIKRN